MAQQLSDKPADSNKPCPNIWCGFVFVDDRHAYADKKQQMMFAHISVSILT